MPLTEIAECTEKELHNALTNHVFYSGFSAGSARDVFWLRFRRAADGPIRFIESPISPFFFALNFSHNQLESGPGYHEGWKKAGPGSGPGEAPESFRGDACRRLDSTRIAPAAWTLDFIGVTTKRQFFYAFHPGGVLEIAPDERSDPG